MTHPPSPQDRGNTPLHVAAQAGQAMQVELLVANGAHPSTLDKLGHTPEECARYMQWEPGGKATVFDTPLLWSLAIHTMNTFFLELHKILIL